MRHYKSINAWVPLYFWGVPYLQFVCTYMCVPMGVMVHIYLCSAFRVWILLTEKKNIVYEPLKWLHIKNLVFLFYQNYMVKQEHLRLISTYRSFYLISISYIAKETCDEIIMKLYDTKHSYKYLRRQIDSTSWAIIIFIYTSGDVINCLMMLSIALQIST